MDPFLVLGRGLIAVVFDAPGPMEDRIPGELRGTWRLDNLFRNYDTCIEGKLLYVKHKLLRMIMNSSMKEHWDEIYAALDADELTWYEEIPEPSNKLLSKCHINTKKSN
jgi:hypothetical protein